MKKAEDRDKKKEKWVSYRLATIRELYLGLFQTSTMKPFLNVALTIFVETEAVIQTYS